MLQKHHNQRSRISSAGLLITLGIIYGDIGTSPLYVLKAIVGEEMVSKQLIYGALSCIFWTLTLQTTFKYVILTLRADNNGEGGIFSLFALVRRKMPWLFVPAMIGGSALLADGIITPPISVASAIEGLRIIQPSIPTVPIIIAIITMLFALQRFGTKIVGNAFGPIMMAWFTMLAVLGINQIGTHLEIIKAINPYYGYKLLVDYPGGFWLLGAVFLCTTGAEALYSDLGHCGKENIRVSWTFVKSCLLLNYFGQGAWLITNKEGIQLFENPFYSVMPDWFLITGIIVATAAAIIASQALISGSFTLISEAIRLNFWPKVKLNYPTEEKGQLYVPSLNKLLWAGCIGIVLYFQESSKMEAAYGLSITITMLMTTLLLTFYLYMKRVNIVLIALFFIVFICIESSFLVANLTKFKHGGFVSLILGGLIFIVMFVWFKAWKLKNKLTEYVEFEDKHINMLMQLSNDISVPKSATNLIFMTSARQVDQIEAKVIYSIFQKQPKRADVYWFLHVEITDDPYTLSYKVKTYQKGHIFRVTFYIGFRIENKINLYFRKVVGDLVKNHEVNIMSRYESLSAQNMVGDFKFVVLEKFLSNENDLPALDRLILDGYFLLKEVATSEEKYFGLDTSSVTVEKVPLLIRPMSETKLSRLI